MNENLCRALLQAGLSEDDVAARLQVDPKTVRRWVEGRVPYLRHRWALAAIVGLTETDLWPGLRGAPTRPGEVQAVYPHLGGVPEEVWLRLFGSARREIGILADATQPLAGYPRVLTLLSEKALGVAVRICLPAPDVPAIHERAATQQASAPVAAQLREALATFASLRDQGQAEIRLHRGITYSAIYYADNNVLVAQHAYGISAMCGPVLSLSGSREGDMTSAYLASFADVWASAQPWDGG